MENLKSVCVKHDKHHLSLMVSTGWFVLHSYWNYREVRAKKGTMFEFKILIPTYGKAQNLFTFCNVYWKLADDFHVSSYRARFKCLLMWLIERELLHLQICKSRQDPNPQRVRIRYLIKQCRQAEKSNDLINYTSCEVMETHDKHDLQMKLCP